MRERETGRGEGREREREREIERDSLFSICWMRGKDSDASLSHISPKWTLSARTLLFFVSTFQSKKHLSKICAFKVQWSGWKSVLKKNSFIRKSHRQCLPRWCVCCCARFDSNRIKTKKGQNFNREPKPNKNSVFEQRSSSLEWRAPAVQMLL